jgi:hypothetical protein
MGAERDQLASRLSRVLATSQLAWDDRVHAAAVVFVTEALSPFWHRGYTPAEAHEQLRAREPELADAIEALAPMLLGRLAAADEAAELIEFVEHFVISSPSR